MFVIKMIFFLKFYFHFLALHRAVKYLKMDTKFIVSAKKVMLVPNAKAVQQDFMEDQQLKAKFVNHVNVPEILIQKNQVPVIPSLVNVFFV